MDETDVSYTTLQKSTTAKVNDYEVLQKNTTKDVYNIPIEMNSPPTKQKKNQCFLMLAVMVFVVVLLIGIINIAGIMYIIYNTSTTCTCPSVMSSNCTTNMSYLSSEIASSVADMINTRRSSYEESLNDNMSLVLQVTSRTVEAIKVITDGILNGLQNKSFLSFDSCKSLYPNYPSGSYHINGQNVYCNMDQLCGSGGGWTRVGYLDMSDDTTSCPDGYRLYNITSGNVRACGRPTSNSGSCTTPLIFPTNGISYTQICGRVTGYQHSTPDAVDTRYNPTNDINSYYLDGVSITRGSPREHVWSLLGGVSEAVSDDGNCPCNNPPGGTQRNVSFMGTDYFCESGNPTGVNFTFFPNDPLWDGQGCGSMEGSCCAAPGLSWFHRDYGNMSSTDFIELRVCGNQGTGDEDTPISLYEIYVK